MKPVIDQEIQGLIPPMTEEERSLLEQLLLAEGRCRDALVVWSGHNLLLDGHNRLEICERHSLPYSIEAKEFADRRGAINWVIDNQLGRRNLTEERKAYLRGRRYQETKDRLAAGGDHRNGTVPVSPSKAAEQLAATHGVSERTIYRDAKYADTVDRLVERAEDADLDPEAVRNLLLSSSKVSKEQAFKLAELGDEALALELQELLKEGAPKKPKPWAVITEMHERGAIGKRAYNELQGLGKAAHSRFLSLLHVGLSVAEALKEMSCEPGDEPDPDTPPPPLPKAPQKRVDLFDQTGAVVPDHLRDVFADLGLPNLIGCVEQALAMISPEAWEKLARGLCAFHGFLLIDKFQEHTWEAAHRMQLAAEALRAGVPHAVCPTCGGQESRSEGSVCAGCRGYGAVPQHRYEELVAAG